MWSLSWCTRTCPSNKRIQVSEQELSLNSQGPILDRLSPRQCTNQDDLGFLLGERKMHYTQELSGQNPEFPKKISLPLGSSQGERITFWVQPIQLANCLRQVEEPGWCEVGWVRNVFFELSVEEAIPLVNDIRCLCVVGSMEGPLNILTISLYWTVFVIEGALSSDCNHPESQKVATDKFQGPQWCEQTQLFRLQEQYYYLKKCQ